MTTKTIPSVTYLTPATSDARVSTRHMATALLLILAGLVLILTVGFAQVSGGFLHNAAHDTRHASTFPCH